RRKDPREPRRVELLDPRLCFEDARVVDERRDWAELRIDSLEEAHDVRLGRHVGLYGDGASATRYDVGDDGIRGRAIGAVVHANGVAALRGEARGGGTDTAAAAGHEHDAHWT